MDAVITEIAPLDVTSGWLARRLIHSPKIQLSRTPILYWQLHQSNSTSRRFRVATGISPGLPGHRSQSACRRRRKSTLPMNRRQNDGLIYRPIFRRGRHISFNRRRNITGVSRARTHFVFMAENRHFPLRHVHILDLTQVGMRNPTIRTTSPPCQSPKAFPPSPRRKHHS